MRRVSSMMDARKAAAEARSRLEVFGEASVAIEPSDETLDDPAARMDREANSRWRFAPTPCCDHCRFGSVHAGNDLSHSSIRGAR